MATPSTAPSTPPWHASFPPPASSPVFLPRESLLALFKEGKVSGQEYVLVDLRRIDHEGGTIKGSINLPAQTLYPAIPSLYNLFHVAGVEKVIWYCGSSQGRGTRAAGWFADYILARGDEKMKSMALAGGIKGWVAAGTEYHGLIDGYDPKVWEK